VVLVKVILHKQPSKRSPNSALAVLVRITPYDDGAVSVGMTGLAVVV